MAPRVLIAEKTLNDKTVRGHCSRCGQAFSEVIASKRGPAQTDAQVDAHPCIDTKRLRKGLFRLTEKSE